MVAAPPLTQVFHMPQMLRFCSGQARGQATLYQWLCKKAFFMFCCFCLYHPVHLSLPLEKVDTEWTGWYRVVQAEWHFRPRYTKLDRWTGWYRQNHDFIKFGEKNNDHK